jgi:hypothetical protein
LTHITEARVIGCHAEMGGASQEDSPLAVLDRDRAGVRRRASEETDVAESTWDSEGGATEEGESAAG